MRTKSQIVLDTKTSRKEYLFFNPMGYNFNEPLDKVTFVFGVAVKGVEKGIEKVEIPLNGSMVLQDQEVEREVMRQIELCTADFGIEDWNNAIKGDWDNNKHIVMLAYIDANSGNFWGLKTKDFTSEFD